MFHCRYTVNYLITYKLVTEKIALFLLINEKENDNGLQRRLRRSPK